MESLHTATVKENPKLVPKDTITINFGRILLRIIVLFGCILSLIPLVLGWHVTHDLNGKVYSSMQSLEFKYSLIASVSISIPIAIDFLFEVLSKYYEEQDPQLAARILTNDHIPKAVLIFSLMIPDLIMLLVALPLKNAEILNCVFQIRIQLATYGIFGHLYECGGQIFQSSALISIEFLLITAGIFLCHCGFDISYQILLYYIYLILVIIGVGIFIYLIHLWVKQVREIEFIHLTSSELSCNVYIFFTLLVLICFTILIFMDNGSVNANTSSFYLSGFTYVETVFTLSISVLQGRINRREMLRAQKETLEIKRIFVRFISHEIRTPLNSVFMGLDILQEEMNKYETEDTECALTTLQDIHSSCNFAIEILNELLNYEKLEAGIMDLERTLLPVHDFVETAVKPFHIQARKAQIGLLVKFGYVHPQALIHGDKARLNQVVRNVLANSVKYTPPGGSISVNFCSIAEERPEKDATVTQHHSLVMEIVDTGCGIEQDDLRTVFQEIRTKSMDKRGKNGSVKNPGLGLWISKSIVELHSGSIIVASEGRDCGCTVRITLPLKIVEANRRPSIFSKILSNPISSAHVTPRVLSQFVAGDTPAFRRHSTAANMMPFSLSSKRFDRGRSLDDGPTVGAFPRRSWKSDRENSFQDNRFNISIVSKEDLGLVLSEGNAVEPTHSSISMATTEYNLFPTHPNRVLPQEPGITTSSSLDDKISLRKTRKDQHVLQTLSLTNSNDLDSGCCSSLPTEEETKMAKKSSWDIYDITSHSIVLNSTRMKSELNKTVIIKEETKDRSDAKVTETPSSPSYMSSGVPSYGKRVLVVDDAPMNRKMLKRLVRDRAETVDEAVDGCEALKCYQSRADKNESPYDVILMDFQMPNMDGPTAAERMRGLGYNGLIIGVTGNALISDISYYVEKGADRVLIKPISLQQLDNVVSDLKRQGGKY